MNISLFESGGAVFFNRECIHGFAFKLAALWDQSALLPVICAGKGLLRVDSAHMRRVGCLSPQSCMA